MKNKKWEIGNLDWKRICFGIGLGVLTMIVGAGLIAWLENRQMLDQEHLSFASVAMLVIGGLTGGAGAGRGEGRFVRCAVTAGGIVLILLLLNLICFDGQLGGLLPGILVIGGSSEAFALLTGGAKGRRTKYKPYKPHKYRNR